MDYSFPIIENITDILPAIRGDDSFIVVDKDGGYTVVNYILMGNATFPPITDEYSKIRRECRGLIFDTETGDIISRRFHKFFNAGERTETLPENIDINAPHNVYEKLDGSMVTPIRLSGGIRWATKMGITDVSMQAEIFVCDHPNYTDFADRIMSLGYTPIFEWCSRKNRIVLDYPKDELVLLAIRHNKTGAYVEMASNSDVFEFNIPVVQSLKADIYDWPEFVNSVLTNPEGGSEGWVVCFYNGHRVKVKTQWYVNLHRVKSAINKERNLVTLILEEQLDDLKAFMLPEDLEKVDEYVDTFWENIELESQALYNVLHNANKICVSRKDFAVYLQEQVEDDILTTKERSIIFKFMDNNDLTFKQIIIKIVGDHLSSPKRFDKVRRLINIEPLKWEDTMW